MRSIVMFILAYALCPAIIGAQEATTASADALRYAQSRQASGKGFVLAADEAADRLRGPLKPVVVDLHPEDEAQKLRVKGALRRDFVDLFSPRGLAGLKKDRPVLLIDSGSYTAVEAMVLLRLLGYQAYAVPGGMVPLAQGIKKRAESSPANSGLVSQALEGENASNLDQLQPPASEPAKLPFWKTVPVGLEIAVAAFSLLSGGLALWFLVFQPCRRARVLLKAARMLEGGGDAALAEAEALLTEALDAGLRPPSLKQEARFLLAYVKARLGQSPEALLVLKDSVPARDSSVESLYLDLWLKVKDHRWDDAERRWYEHSNALSGFLDSKELAGIVFLEQARKHLARKSYDKTLECFLKVRQLGVFADQIPEHLTDLELVLALNALFGEGGSGLAAQRFEAARKSAETDRRSTLLPRIGLLLCQWKDESHPDVDAKLAEILGEVKKEAAEAGEKSEAAKLLPHIALWYAISLLYQWILRRPGGGGLKVNDRKDLESRLQTVREQMPKSGDADLIGGLVDYYFAAADRQRQAALNLLKNAIEAGVTLPEVLYLVQCEERLAQLSKNRLESYLALLKAYLKDSAVPLELRRQLYEHLRAFERFRELAAIEIQADEGSLAPSLHDVTASCELIEERVGKIFRGYSDDKKRSELEKLLGALREARGELGKTVAELGVTEQRLMRVAGEALLPEEAEAER